MACGAQCARVVLIIFNTIFWLTGAALLGVGIWFLLDPEIKHYTEIVKLDNSEPIMQYLAYGVIGLGGFVFIVGMFGCCGALRESKCCLGIYIFFLVIVLAGEVGAGVIGIIYKGQILDEIEAQLKTSVSEPRDDNDPVKQSWDYFQTKSKCCGSSGPLDYPGIGLPASCCSVDIGCTAITAYQEGCTKKIFEDMTNNNFMIIIAVAIAIACIEILGVVFACCLCRTIDVDKD